MTKRQARAGVLFLTTLAVFLSGCSAHTQASGPAPTQASTALQSPVVSPTASLPVPTTCAEFLAQSERDRDKDFIGGSYVIYTIGWAREMQEYDVYEYACTHNTAASVTLASILAEWKQHTAACADFLKLPDAVQQSWIDAFYVKTKTADNLKADLEGFVTACTASPSSTLADVQAAMLPKGSLEVTGTVDGTSADNFALTVDVTIGNVAVTVDTKSQAVGSALVTVTGDFIVAITNDTPGHDYKGYGVVQVNYYYSKDSLACRQAGSMKSGNWRWVAAEQFCEISGAVYTATEPIPSKQTERGVERSQIFFSVVVAEGDAASFAKAVQSPTFAGMYLQQGDALDTSPAVCPTNDYVKIVPLNNPKACSLAKF
jgi:hypothetical protein